MPYVREEINAHIQDNINKAVTNKFTTFSPIWAFLGAAGTYDRKNPYDAATGAAGRPTPARFFGDAMGMTRAQKRSVLGSMDHQIRFVKSEPDDGDTVGYGGTYPTAANYAEDNFGTARFRWGDYVEPIKIRKHFLEMARGITAVNKAADDATKPVLERMFKRVTTDFWTGSLNAAQQGNVIWGGSGASGVLGLQHQVGTGNVFGSVDRATQSELNANVWAAGTVIGTSSTVELGLVRKVQHGFVRTDTSAAVTGITTRTTTGQGVSCVVTTSELWNSLAEEADGRYEITTNGIPGTAMAGFKNPIINYDGIYITYDNFCPSGEMYLLCMDCWSLEIQQGKDFMFDGLKDETQLKRGGEAVEFGHFRFTSRLICHAPHLQTKITGLSANS